MKQMKTQTAIVQDLERLRDELKVQAHLFKGEAKQEWEKLEKDMQTLRQQSKPIQVAAEKSAAEVQAATKLLFQTIKHGYERIKSALPR